MADGGNGGRRGLWCQPSCVKMHPGCKPCKSKRGEGLTSDIFPSGIFSFEEKTIIVNTIIFEMRGWATTATTTATATTRALRRSL